MSRAAILFFMDAGSSVGSVGLLHLIGFLVTKMSAQSSANPASTPNHRIVVGIESDVHECDGTDDERRDPNTCKSARRCSPIAVLLSSHDPLVAYPRCLDLVWR